MERRGKAKQAQYFDDRVVYKWTERLSKSDALNCECAFCWVMIMY